MIRRHGEALSPLNCGRVVRVAVADLAEVVVFNPEREPGIARDSRIIVAMSGMGYNLDGVNLGRQRKGKRERDRVKRIFLVSCATEWIGTTEIERIGNVNNAVCLC